MRCYPSQRLHEEVAYVARQLSWSYRDLMGMEHAERLRWVAQAARLAGDGGGSDAARWR